ncbi:hypothetical protein [Mesorhizobium sp. J428]|uniref:hypothetical protein n=1 Tax=Mesorhizobium sp. J428 TaxID=2898440 RepID=UPI002151789E|nr:hypothetical protein [Mesorhizobium sp. J428]MCR5860138.1 hypothetical protein [Mesorhizobium sp. J428]MCR5860167.1 hypothetical protein [Mesorhizobium sp. J428]MCR5860203.1 hypothetical protein [Mesorhizobium sp. J428]
MATAQEYAEKNISSPKQRTTFMDHLRNVMDTAMERAAVPAEQRQEAPDKSKSRESAPIER